MFQPSLFIPRQRLVLPMEADPEVHVSLVSENRPHEFTDINRTRKSLARQIPHLPLMETWGDGHGTTIFLSDEHDKKIGTFAVEAGRLLTPVSTDGIALRPEELKLIAFGVELEQGEGQLGVMWGILSHALEDLEADPSAVDSFLISGADASNIAYYQAIFEHCFPDRIATS